MKTYTITGTTSVATADMAGFVRLQSTVGENGVPAIMWTFRDGRFTSFSSEREVVRSINRFVAVLMEDSTLIADLDKYTDQYTR